MKKTALILTLAAALLGCTAGGPTAGIPDPAPAERKGAPEFDLENIAGGSTKTAEIKGKVAIVDFWATWCQPCIAEIPNFNKLHDEYQGKDVQVIAITIESDHDDIAPKVKETGMKYTVLVGNDKVVDGFGGVLGFPTTFVVTKDWKIYKKYLGALPDKDKRIKMDIEKLLGEQASPAD